MYWQCPRCGRRIPATQDEIITCSCGERRLPGLATRLKHFSFAAVKHLLKGNPTCTEEQINQRIEICKECNRFTGTACASCGCNCNREQQYLNKLAWADQKCPEGKWSEIKPAWITTEQLTKDIKLLVQKLPPDITVIVGAARSGLIVGSQLASYLHLPLYSIDKKDGLLPCGKGFRYDEPSWKGPFLLVDDTICTGQTIPLLRSRIKAECLTAVVYCEPTKIHLVDYFVRPLAIPHYLEWNLYNSFYNNRVAYDMDGIICTDETRLPLNLTRKGEIVIITSRLEKDREATMAWLNKYHIEVKQLYMGPWRTVAERAKPHAIRDYKASILKKIRPKLYVESCPILAKELAKATTVDILCPALGKIL